MCAAYTCGEFEASNASILHFQKLEGCACEHTGRGRLKKWKISNFLLFPKSLLWKVHRKPLLVSPSAVVAGGDPKKSKKCAQLTPVANLKPPMYPFYISKSLKAAHVNTRVEMGSKTVNFLNFGIFNTKIFLKSSYFLYFPSDSS